MDLIIRRAKLRGRVGLWDLAIKNGCFAQIKAHMPSGGRAELDAGGNLVIPPFVESHVHLDSALQAGKPRFNDSGTLLEAIEIWGERRAGLSKEQVKQAARKTILWEIANGVLRIRTHADSTDPDLITIEALLELKKELAEYVDLQVVAFPQDGIFSTAGAARSLVRAVEAGVDVIGGIPQQELTREDGIRSVEYVFELAQKHGKLVDIHTDETGDDQSRFAEVIAKETIVNGMEGLVTASHTTAMHNYHNDYAAKLIGLLRRADVNIVTNPGSNLLLQNRLDGYPKGRGHTRVDQLLAAGVNVSVGNDNIMDPFGPFGKGSMLQSAHLLIHTAHLSGRPQMDQVFDMITTNGARTLHLNDYGIEEGNSADCVILDAADEYEALRLTSECLYVIRRGKIIACSTPARREVRLAGRAETVDFKI